jgi:hypothetical protein
MAVTRLTTNGLTGTKYDIASADNYYMEPIATTLVGSGGVSSVSFTGIPQGYKHLQLRVFAKTNRATYASDSLLMTFNSDTSANYSTHNLSCDGSGTIAQGYANTGNFPDGFEHTGTVNGSGFGAIIYDILDYSNTTKYKVSRAFGGFDTNGTVAGYGGHVGIGSGSWRNTAGITSLSLTPQYGSLILQHSRFSLYGIKG